MKEKRIGINMNKRIFSIKKDFKHTTFSFCGLKLKIKNGLNKTLIKNFFKHDIDKKTILLVELNDCHYETLPGYYKLIKDCGYDVEVLIQGYDCDVFSRFKEKPIFWECFPKDIEYIFNNFDFSKYERIIYNSKRIYGQPNDIKCEGVDIQEVYANLPKGQKENIFVQHHIDKMDLNNCTNQIVLANPSGDKRLNSHVVNPNYFGEVEITEKNDKIVNFITVGELSEKRRSSKLLIESVKKLVDNNINNFKITVVGKGSLDDIPPKYQTKFDIKGRLNFSEMYKKLEEADFFLPLLDPELEAHKRYMNDGTSGSFQLIYGFLKPCIIHKVFADIYGFSERNSLIYGSNSDILSAITTAIKIKNDNYVELQKELHIIKSNININSIKNIGEVLC